MVCLTIFLFLNVVYKNKKRNTLCFVDTKKNHLKNFERLSKSSCIGPKRTCVPACMVLVIFHSLSPHSPPLSAFLITLAHFDLSFPCQRVNPLMSLAACLTTPTKPQRCGLTAEESLEVNRSQNNRVTWCFSTSAESRKRLLVLGKLCV